MKDKIAKLLYSGIDKDEILSVLASSVYELIQNQKQTHPLLFSLMEEGGAVSDFIAAGKGQNAEKLTFSAAELDLLGELDDDLSYLIELAYDNNEDLVMEQLLSGHWGAEVRQDLEARGIELTDGHIDRDTVELSYKDVFLDYDQSREKLTAEVMAMPVKELFEQGKAEKEAYRRKHHILFDENDFIAEYNRTFHKATLWRMLADRLEQAFSYGRHYTLISPEEEEDEEGYFEESAPEGLNVSDPSLYLPEDYDETEGELLEADGLLRREDYPYVSQLLPEYTGRRVMAAENEWGTGAYWTTYEDDFQEIISYFILEHLEATVDALAEERAVEWNSFGRMLGLEQKDRNDPIQILDHSERINYYLSNFNEQLWYEFTESKVGDFLNAD